MSLVLDYTGGVFAAKPTGGSLGTDPASIGDANFGDVSLLLHMDGSNGSTTFTDSSSYTVSVVANGDAQISTAQSKFGGASAYFDGTGDRLESPSLADLSGGPWTIEGWYYFNTDPNSATKLLWSLNDEATLGYAQLNTLSGTNTLRLQQRGGLYLSDGTYNFDINTWYHIATVWDGTNMKVYVDGTAALSSTTNVIQNAGNGLTINGDGGGSLTFAGYIDEFRISTAARYTSNFTPPTAAFSNTGPTLNLSSGNTFVHAPSANVAYAFSNPPASGTAIDFTLKVTPSATVTIAWPSSVKWAGGTAPSAPASGETDAFTFYSTDGGTSYYGFQAGDAYS